MALDLFGLVVLFALGDKLIKIVEGLRGALLTDIYGNVGIRVLISHISGGMESRQYFPGVFFLYDFWFCMRKLCESLPSSGTLSKI